MEKYKSLKVRKHIHEMLTESLDGKTIIIGWVEEAILEKLKKEKKEMSGFTDYSSVPVTLGTKP